MDDQEQLRRKMIPVEEAVLKVQSGSFLYTYGASAEPTTFFDHLHLLKGLRRDITIVTLLNSKCYDFYQDDAYRDLVRTDSLFFGRFCTGLQRTGRASFVPNHMRNSGADRIWYHGATGRPLSLYVIPVTPMDRHGYFCTSTAAVASRELIEHADMVMVEVNEHLPRTFGDTYLHISEVDWVFPSSSPVLYLPDKGVSPEDMQIGSYIAELIDDGSTIQLGIGGIPNAVALALRGKKDLGVHTEMLNDGLVQLYQEGVITNRRKTLYKDKMVTTFTFGSKETYDFLDDNIGVLHLNVGQCNSPWEIARNEKMVSVNTTLQIDLSGQCASEALGTLQISGTGGQSETAIGAKMARGGKSIIALHSAAMVKNESGERERRSTIVAVHPAGTMISLLRADTDFVVTEYGVAALRGASLRERARSLISIAHPDFRPQLEEDARHWHLL